MQRQLIFLACLCFTCNWVNAQQKRQSVNLDWVASLAKAKIEQPFETRPTKLPSELDALTYDQYREIRFRPSEALWWNTDLPFRVEFFHLGHIFKDKVEISEVSGSHSQSIPYLSKAFDFGTSGYSTGILNQPPGYAGFRVKYPLNRSDVYDDLIVFQGASYFRALGSNQSYGLSLRGLAMNTLGEKEDFPRFTQFWIRKPAGAKRTLTIYALLEGEKVTGAYAFTIKPNGRTRIHVKARLYFRKNGLGEVGIAPITSMFTFGENTYDPPNDWRPEVHDSDGLLLHADTEWTWHALDNLPGRFTKVFPCGKLSGFGLMQRDRAFGSYEDLEAQYERRPSAWITPVGRWKNGSVILYTFNIAQETIDNVVAFWKPDPSPKLQSPVEIEYYIDLQLTDPAHELAKVLETRVGERTLHPGDDTVMIEFSRPKSLTPNEVALLDVDFRSGDARLLEEPIILYNAVEDNIRVFANLRRPEDAAKLPVEMNARLLRQGHIVSEKWSYAWHP